MASFDRFFQSSTELNDLVEGQDAFAGGPFFTDAEIWSVWPYSKTEIRIIEGRFRELLASGPTFADFLALLQQHGAVWILGNVFLCRPRDNDARLDGMHHLSMVTFHGSFRVEYEGHPHTDEGWSEVLVCSCAGLPVPTIESPFERVFELLAQEQAQRLVVEQEVVSPVAPEALVLLFAQNHQCVSFTGFDFSSQAHCVTLASYRGDLSLKSCQLHDSGRSIFDRVARDQGPDRLTLHFGGRSALQVDFASLRIALSQTKSLLSLALTRAPSAGLPELVSGLADNKSLILFCCSPSERRDQGQWSELIESLRTHPTLEALLVLPSAEQSVDNFSQERVGIARAIADMLKVNKVLRQVIIKNPVVHVSEPWAGIVEEILRKEIRPRLEDNLFRRRFKAIAAERNASFKRSLVFAALRHDKIRGNPSLLKRLLSTFHDVISQQFEDAEAARPVAGRTRKRKRKLEL